MINFLWRKARSDLFHDTKLLIKLYNLIYLKNCELFTSWGDKLNWQRKRGYSKMKIIPNDEIQSSNAFCFFSFILPFLHLKFYKDLIILRTCFFLLIVIETHFWTFFIIIILLNIYIFLSSKYRLCSKFSKSHLPDFFFCRRFYT